MTVGERRTFFTKQGLDQIASELDLEDERGRPHGLATYNFWNFVSQEMKVKSLQSPLRDGQDGGEFTTPELVTKTNE